MPDNGMPLHRAPGEMETWEIIVAYRHAYQLASLAAERPAITR
jgi:hypothetical protein